MKRVGLTPARMIVITATITLQHHFLPQADLQIPSFEFCLGAGEYGFLTPSTLRRNVALK